MEYKKTIAITAMLAVYLTVSLIFSAVVYAGDDCEVIYEGNAEEFVFVPESTDLFRNFKNVYPGDTLTQKINVRNSCNTDIAVYLRAEAVDKEYSDFLDNMYLTINKSDGSVISYSKASEQGSLKENILLGTFSPDESTSLNVTLDVDKVTDNGCQNMTGKVKWIFSVVEEEETIIFDKPDSVETGDSRKGMVTAAIVLLVISLSVAIPITVIKKKHRCNI